MLAEWRERWDQVVRNEARAQEESTSLQKLARQVLQESEGLNRRFQSAADRLQNGVGRIEKLEAVEGGKQLEELLGNLKSLEARVSEIEAAARKALEDYRILKGNLQANTEKSLAEFRESLSGSLEEIGRLSASVEKATGRVDRVAAEMDERLAASVDRHVGGTVTNRVEPLLNNLDKMINRLEARGASPFKTAQAQILQHLRNRGDIGGKHTAMERALECLPVRDRDVGKDALEDLIRKGLVVEKATGYGRHVALNQDRLADVQRVIDGEDIPGSSV